jgi:hypothetical protein
MDFMLRTNTEAQMDDALEAAGIIVEQNIGEGEIALFPVTGITLDRIGTIPAQMDEKGIIVRPGDSRYHVNLRATIDIAEAQIDLLPTFNPVPTIPYRVFL